MLEKFQNSKKLQFLVFGGAAFIIIVSAIVAIVMTLNKEDEFVPVTQSTEDEERPLDWNGSKAQSVETKIETVAEGLTVPWALAFTHKNRILVTERGGDIRVIDNGKLLPEPLATFPETAAEGEAGLMGLARDPQYDQNDLIYVCLSYYQDGGMYDKVVRLRDEPGGPDRTTILSAIPSASIHAGCRIKFGPDGKLYVTTGDAGVKEYPQDRKVMAGKILRINGDGSIPADNPLGALSPVWSFGHRNPQGIAWQPISRTLYATEHGPSGNDGSPGGDELNIIRKNGNYGWPFVSHDQTRGGTVRPVLTFTPAVAPAGAAFYSGTAIPQFTNNLFFGMLRGEGLYRVVFDSNDRNKILSRENVSGINVGRVREVIEGFDGALYFTSSNRDGRGDPRAGDDKVMRIAPR